MNAPTIELAIPTPRASGRTSEPTIQPASPTPGSSAHLLDSGHTVPVLQRPPAAVDPSPTTTMEDSVAIREASSSGQPPIEPPATLVGAADGEGGHYRTLRMWSEMYDDIQRLRIATENRIRAASTATPPIDAGIFEEYLKSLAAAEQAAKKSLGLSYRLSVPAPIRAWQKEQKGIGVHLLARLLGHLGDPSIATPYHWEGTGTERKLIPDLPFERTVAHLWSYCGHGDPTRRARKGMTAEEAAALGNPMLKKLVFLLAEACMKQQSGNLYRDLYEHRRIVTANRVHATPCVRCGPSGNPAAEGSPWSKAHHLADALRIVGKEILRDLWIVSRGGTP